jgi:hypothetical protein
MAKKMSAAEQRQRRGAECGAGEAGYRGDEAEEGAEQGKRVDGRGHEAKRDGSGVEGGFGEELCGGRGGEGGGVFCAGA